MLFANYCLVLIIQGFLIYCLLNVWKAMLKRNLHCISFTVEKSTLNCNHRILVTNDLLEAMSYLIIHQTLKQARLPLVPRDTCKRSYSDFRSSGYCVTRRMRCAGYARGGVDACKGDSGGPLVCQRNRKRYLMGVVSWGAGCGLVGRYGVYADVLKLKKWIQETIQDA